MKDSQHSSELLQAGDADGLSQVLEQDPVASKARDATGVSLLMHCLYRGRRDLAELIASKKKALDIFEATALAVSIALKNASGMPPPSIPARSTRVQKTASPPCTSPVSSDSLKPPACSSKTEPQSTPWPRIRHRSCRCTPPPPPATSKPPPAARTRSPRECPPASRLGSNSRRRSEWRPSDGGPVAQAPRRSQTSQRRRQNSR